MFFPLHYMMFGEWSQKDQLGISDILSLFYFLLFFLKILLEYSWLTVLCYFQVYS